MKLQRKDCHHVAHRLTFKVQGKTCTVYVPLDRVKDVETWTKEYKRLTGRLIDLENAWKVAAAARLRWRCENEGFNVLKTGGFALEHVYSHNPVASKCYFMLMLIAHISCSHADVSTPCSKTASTHFVITAKRCLRL